MQSPKSETDTPQPKKATEITAAKTGVGATATQPRIGATVVNTVVTDASARRMTLEAAAVKLKIDTAAVKTATGSVAARPWIGASVVEQALESIAMESGIGAAFAQKSELLNSVIIEQPASVRMFQSVLDSINWPQKSPLSQLGISADLTNTIDTIKAINSTSKILKTSLSPIAAISQEFRDKLALQMNPIGSVLKASETHFLSINKSISDHLSILDQLQPLIDTPDLTEYIRSAIDYNEALEEVNSESEIKDSLQELISADSEEDRSRIFSNFSDRNKRWISVFIEYLRMAILAYAVNQIPSIKEIQRSFEKDGREGVMNLLTLSHEKAEEGRHFISGEGVRLRKRATTKSAIIETLNKGQVVYLLSKSKNNDWVEVYFYEDEDTVKTGWVFARYARKLE